jgi:hypothetical protein
LPETYKQQKGITYFIKNTRTFLTEVHPVNNNGKMKPPLIFTSLGLSDSRALRWTEEKVVVEMSIQWQACFIFY